LAKNLQEKERRGEMKFLSFSPSPVGFDKRLPLTSAPTSLNRYLGSCGVGNWAQSTTATWPKTYRRRREGEK
jgi:hypothetical protein